MTATNHALTGALIGLMVGQPLIALPAAIMSHFICDMIPHYSSDASEKKVLQSDGFRRYLIAEASICFSLVVVLAITQPLHWFLAAACAFLATSPDLLWINRFLTIRGGKTWHPNAFSRFASDIQWFAKPIGAVVEAVWFVCAVGILAMFLV